MEIKDRYTLKDKLKAMGPGILVVGSFIGPGTVTSATKAGAGYGYALLWTVVFSVIAVIVMQEMAARLGIVTQNGLAEELVKDLSDRPPLKWLMVALVAAAITLGGFAYMGGDLTGTAIGLSAITGIPSNIIAPIWGCCILVIINIGDAVKSLEKLLSVCVSVMAIVFVVTMIVVKPDLGAVFSGALPSVPEGSIMTCVSLIGTTVVPYNMFIHATSSRKTWHDPKQLPLARFDTTVSMIIGGLITGSVMITAGTVMRGMEVNSAIDMAVQLEPTLGSFSVPFLAMGLIAAGISSAVITPLGVSYVLAGLFGWEMNKKDKRFGRGRHHRGRHWLQPHLDHHDCPGRQRYLPSHHCVHPGLCDQPQPCHGPVQKQHGPECSGRRGVPDLSGYRYQQPDFPLLIQGNGFKRPPLPTSGTGGRFDSFRHSGQALRHRI